MKKGIITVTVVLLIIVCGAYYAYTHRLYVEQQTPEPSSQNPETVAIAQSAVRVFSPMPNDIVTSPLQVFGEARGTWFFEASFPVVLEDGNGTVIASGPAQAKSDWMTEDFVPFEITLKFTKPAVATGTLFLKKDNPSGDPKRDDSVPIPVRFR